MATNEGTGDASSFRIGLPAGATPENRKVSDVCWASSCQAQKRRGEFLSEYLAEGFRESTVEDLEIVNSNTRSDLCNLLRHCGVSVPKGLNVPIASTLHQFVQEELL